MESVPPRLILASGSPRRARVLRQLGLEFSIVPPEADESARPGEGPGELAERLARRKAEKVVRAGAISFGFDTLVAHRGTILGKPRDEPEAVEMIRRLAGDAHEVYTGIAAAMPGRVESAVERTTVRMRTIDLEEAAAYVATGEPLDKAGAYGIQGTGASLVTGVDGDFFNVMGFPVQRFRELLERLGWRYHFGRILPIDGAAAGVGHAALEDG